MIVCLNYVKFLGTKKVGHTGTLDPSVEGVLPICIGQATKVAEYITDAGKEYVAVVSIGKATETEDADGAVVTADDYVKENYDVRQLKKH